MPAVSAPDLAILRTYPHKSNLYLIVQQPMYRVSNVWHGFLWAAQINGAPAGTAGDLVASLTVDNAELGDAKWMGAAPANVALLDGMTVFVGTAKGDHDKGIFVVRTDQTVDATTTTLNIGVSSDVIDIVEDDDWVVVLDEFRLWTRYPRVTEAGGALTWYKDYDVLFTDLGGTAEEQRQAEMPVVPILGPHRIVFIDPDDSETVDFDWSNSYATTGATVNAWDSEGKRGATAGAWTSAIENPAAQVYTGTATDADNDISGLAGFRVQLIPGTDQTDPAARFRRGVRYVFTLRRPGEATATDPVHAEPITDFSVSGLSGSYDDGGWRCTVTVFDSQAHEYEIMPGALVILFAEDWYGSTKDSIGPIVGCENIVFVGHIADGSVRQDPETGDVTFDVLGAAGQARNRETFPIPVENDDGATEWYQCANLTVDRAAWFYVVWHSTLATICDWYQAGTNGSEEIKAMDFLAGDIYSTLDTFYSERIMGRVLCDRYDRFKVERNLQLQAEGSGTTILTVATGDWLDELQFRESIETPTSIVELGGVNYNAGLINPYLCKAPGTVNRQKGSNAQNMSMAITDQATLNTLAGRWLAALNNRWPDNIFPFGNWRVFDIWPQEYIVASPTTVRHTFSSDKFIVRRVGIEARDGALFVTVNAELETGGVDGQTIDIPDEIPTPYPPAVPFFPPQTPPSPDYDGATDGGRRIIATDVGVFVTDNIGLANPVWYAVNNGLVTSNDRYVYDIKRDPWHWWTSGGTERTLWAITKTGIWKHETFPFGTWVNVVSINEIEANSPRTYAGIAPTVLIDNTIYRGRLSFSAEDEGRFAAVYSGSCTPSGPGQPSESCWAAVFDADDTCISCTEISASDRTFGFGDLIFAPHGGGNQVYAISNYNYDNAGDALATLWKTSNEGVNWTDIDTINNTYRGLYTSVAVPYISPASTDQYVLWGRGGNVVSDSLYRISSNAGASFSNISSSDLTYSVLSCGGQPEYIWLNSSRPDLYHCKWSNDAGMTYNLLPLNAAIVSDSQCSFAIWNGAALKSVIVGLKPNITTAWWIGYWENGRTTWLDKTGNLLSIAVGLAEVFAIDRDSMGTA